MVQDDDLPVEDSVRSRVDGPHSSNSPSGREEIEIRESPDGSILISANLSCADAAEFRRRMEQLLAELHVAGRGEVQADDGVTMKRDSADAADTTRLEAEESGGGGNDVLDWEDLIPVAPARPGGKIQVRLKRRGRDRPLPAEDPWAE